MIMINPLRKVVLITTLLAALVASGCALGTGALPRLSPAGGPAGPASGLGPEDGWLAKEETLSPDDDVPAVSRLDPELLSALRAAAEDAADDGVELRVNSGWRSQAYQQHLLDQAVRQYGSRRKASRWVATPDESAHVSGDAVDIAATDAWSWLGRHGSDYGLCQTYANESWHFELRTLTRRGHCPQPVTDASSG